MAGDDSDKKEVGERLALLEKITGLNGQELAEQFGVSKQQWSHYRVGRIGLPMATARAIKRTYGCTLDWLYIGDESGNSPGFQIRLRAALKDARPFVDAASSSGLAA